MGSPRKWLKLIVARKRLSRETASANEKPSRWTLWKSFHVFDKKLAGGAGEAGLKKGEGGDRSIVSREEIAAIRIQTAFRVCLAKRALRALKGLARLQAAISGHDSRKQSAASLHCIQAFVRVQVRIHRQRAMKRQDLLGMPQQKLAGLTAETCTTDSEMEWCNTIGTLEEIQAKEQQRQVAAIKRERAIAYAFCNKWRANGKLSPGSLFDYELDNSTWSWIWLDQWINGRPSENSNPQLGQIVTRKDSGRKRMVLKKTLSVGDENRVNLNGTLGKSNCSKKAPTKAGSPGRTKMAANGKERVVRLRSPKPDVKLQLKQYKKRSELKQQLSKGSEVKVPAAKAC